MAVAVAAQLEEGGARCGNIPVRFGDRCGVGMVAAVGDELDGGKRQNGDDKNLQFQFAQSSEVNC